MSTVLIILLLLVVVVVGASLALGRTTTEVDSARDTEFLELDGAWVRYKVIGGGPPVVLVHGWLSSSRIWEPLARRLAQRFTVYSLDLVGFGESDKPLSGYGVRNGSRLLYAFCAHFGLTRAGVIGHDFGGSMAVKLAADHPDVVGRIVLVSVPADENQIDLPTPLWLATLPVIGPLFYAIGRAARPVRRMWMRPFVADGGDLAEELVDDAGHSTPAAASRTLSIARREIARGRLVRQARIIKMPMLVVSGEEDQIVDPHSVGEWAGGVDRAEICLIDECGHMPMIERPAEFNAQVLAFLTGDARYLDQAEAPRATPTDDDPEQGEPHHPEQEAEATGASDDTTDLTSEYPIPDHDAPEQEDQRQEQPNVVRRRRGRYSSQPDGSNGADSPPDDEAPAFGELPRRATSSEDAIPELPPDLFDWPEPRREPRTRRPQRDDGSEEEPPESRNGPSQL